MSILDAAEVTSYLDEQRVPYAVIGGMAVQYWGEARQTGDVDIVVLVRPDETANFLETAVQRFRPRIDDAVGRAVSIDLPGGRAIRIISAEDLIIHKCIAGRETLRISNGFWCARGSQSITTISRSGSRGL